MFNPKNRCLSLIQENYLWQIVLIEVLAHTFCCDDIDVLSAELTAPNNLFHQCFTKTAIKPCKLFTYKALIF